MSTDGHQPAEGRFKLTRQVLEVFRAYRNPLGMVPKSPLVIRDAGLLADLARVAKVRIFFTVTTVDLALWRTLEPGTANPFKRLAVMGRLVSAGGAGRRPAGACCRGRRLLSACICHVSRRASVSLDTVKTHVVHVPRRLDVTDRTQAAVCAAQLGLLDEPER